jgi:TPR repeat protein
MATQTAEIAMNTASYTKALRLIESGGSASGAYKLLVQASEAGDFRADYAIGTWYLHGFFLRKSLKKAIRLIKRAADQDIADAAFDMGVSYEKGVGVRQDPSIAVAYYLRAFRCGHGAAVKELERMFYWGIGVEKNRRLAKELAKLE